MNREECLKQSVSSKLTPIRRGHTSSQSAITVQTKQILVKQMLSKTGFRPSSQKVVLSLPWKPLVDPHDPSTPQSHQVKYSEQLCHSTTIERQVQNPDGIQGELVKYGGVSFCVEYSKIINKCKPTRTST